MKILLVGKRAFAGDFGEGPDTAFEALSTGARELGNHWTIYPDKQRNKLLQYLGLFVLLLRPWDAINVHLMANYGLLVGIVYPRSSKTFLTVHGYGKIEGTRHRYNAFMHWLQVKCLFRNRVYVSHHIRQRVEDVEGLCGGEVIPNAVDPLRLPRTHTHGSKSIDVFSLCGYNETKGIQFLLESLGQMEQTVVVLIAGHGAQGNITASRPAGQKAAVSFMGPLRNSEIAAQFSQARVYVQPSLYESFGMPVVEAMYQRVPVVVSRGAGVTDFLENGKDALLVPPGNLSALARAIEMLLNDRSLCHILATNASQTAERFYPATIAREYQELFKRVAR